MFLQLTICCSAHALQNHNVENSVSQVCMCGFVQSSDSTTVHRALCGANATFHSCLQPLETSNTACLGRAKLAQLCKLVMPLEVPCSSLEHLKCLLTLGDCCTPTPLCTIEAGKNRRCKTVSLLHAWRSVCSSCPCNPYRCAGPAYMVCSTPNQLVTDSNAIQA